MWMSAILILYFSLYIGNFVFNFVSKYTHILVYVNIIISESYTAQYVHVCINSLKTTSCFFNITNNSLVMNLHSHNTTYFDVKQQSINRTLMHICNSVSVLRGQDKNQSIKLVSSGVDKWHLSSYTLTWRSKYVYTSIAYMQSF